MSSDNKCELLPCPFCGEKPKLSRVDGWVQIECWRCGNQLGYGRFTSETDAIQIWNTRTPADDPAPVDLTDSDEWRANNLVGLIKSEMALVKAGKRDAIDWQKIGSYFQQFVPAPDLVEKAREFGSCAPNDWPSCEVCGGEVDMYGCLEFDLHVAKVTESLHKQIEEADTLLLRIRSWDHLDAAADGSYWKRAIDQYLQRHSKEFQAAPTFSSTSETQPNPEADHPNEHGE